MIRDNQIIHYTSDEAIRVSIAFTAGIVEKARQSHHLSPVACAALGRTMTGAALLAGDYKNHEGVSIKIAGDGPLGAVHADCFDTNKLRGYVDNPTIDLPLKPNGKLDVSAAVGRNGQMTVTRFTPKTTTYTSQADLVSGEIAEDIAYYLYTSEQVPSTINLGVLVDRDYTIAAAGGFLVQALPGAKDEDLARVEANITQVGALTTYLKDHPKGEGLIDIILGGMHYKELYRQHLYWRCTCSRQRFESALLSLRPEDKESLLKDPQVEMTCHYCGAKYTLSHDEVAALYEKGRDRQALIFNS